MLRDEAIWIGRVLLGLMNQSPVLNVGSQTKAFRSVQQPHIDEFVFRPAQGRGIEVIHTDLQKAEGVDLAGDLCDNQFRSVLRKSRFGTVLCNNLLEHVPADSRTVICNGLVEIVDRAGVLIITVPQSYPYHPDPIDTYFRPKASELCQIFPGCTLIEERTIYGPSLMRIFCEDPILVVSMLIRSLVPFYRFRKWLSVVHRFCWLHRRTRVTGVVLRKK